MLLNEYLQVVVLNLLNKVEVLTGHGILGKLLINLESCFILYYCDE